MDTAAKIASVPLSSMERLLAGTSTTGESLIDNMDMVLLLTTSSASSITFISTSRFVLLLTLAKFSTGTKFKARTLACAFAIEPVKL